MYSEETINRLKDLGYDVEASIPMYYKGVRTKVVPSAYIRRNAKKPVYLGLYNKEGISGTYHGSEDIAFADPTLSSNLDGTIFHERIMHGTDGLLDTYSSIQPEAKQMYQDFINKLFYVEHDNPNYPGTTIRDWAPGVISNGSDLQVDFGNNMIFNIIDGTNTWYEGRATVNELKRRYLHDLWLKAGKPKTLEKVRPSYLEKIDGLTEQELLGDLANKIGGYGQTYVALRKNNPNFIPDLKQLLKHGAMYGAPTAVGAKTFYNIQQKRSGGKLVSRNVIQRFKGGTLK